MSDDLTPARMLAEALDPALFAARRNIDDPDVAQLLHSLEYGPNAAAIARWQHSQPKQRTLRPGETSVRADSGDPHAALVSKLEELARRMSEEATRMNQPGASTPLDQFSTDDASVDPEALKSALTRLERAERTRKLTSKERGEMERLRAAVRSQRDTLKLELAQRGDDLHELRAKRERDKLKLRPSQNAWHHDAAGVEIREDSDGEGIADLLSDNF